MIGGGVISTPLLDLLFYLELRGCCINDHNSSLPCLLPCLLFVVSYQTLEPPLPAPFPEYRLGYPFLPGLTGLVKMYQTDTLFFGGGLSLIQFIGFATCGIDVRRPAAGQRGLGGVHPVRPGVSVILAQPAHCKCRTCSQARTCSDSRASTLYYNLTQTEWQFNCFGAAIVRFLTSSRLRK